MTIVNTIEVDGINVFYRSAGPSSAPVLLLLHGFPSSSFQFRNLIPLLAAKYRVIAPDLPGFGFTSVPDERKYVYTFDSLSNTVEKFLDALSIDKFALYIFDYGAPTAIRLALRSPTRITAIVTQNGNAYDDGFGAAFWKPLQAYWASSTKFSATSPEAQALVPFLSFGTTKWQYTNGVPANLLHRVDPAAYTLDAALLARPGQTEIQLSLFYDYGTNPALYPQFHEYLRKSGVPVLAMWAANDIIFVKPGAEAFKRDVKDVVVKFVDSGHFALETHVQKRSTSFYRSASFKCRNPLVLGIMAGGKLQLILAHRSLQAMYI
ncbi:alpha/beta hydrolase fold protein [Artomyces pyxidatus]|uniref:Alpha/beta hydrolase fold protein n=1 Tax=Artomyces pyxidatus TaxID=48021 RepID=A0ACB8TCE3_9AGAM|nr:alpha/beta hydrolase fold protein [Artomyces pyxidatus]